MSKTKILALILCALPLMSYAQRWNLIHKNSIDILTGIELSANMIEPASANLHNFQQTRKISPRSTINPSYRFGIDYNFALNEKWFLKSGGRFFQSGYRTEDLDLFKPQDIDALERISQNQTVEVVEFKYSFLEIPMMARWVYSGNRCKSFLEFGLSGNVYLNSKIRATGEEGMNSSRSFVKLEDKITPLHLTANMSIGGEFWITKELPAFIQLTGRSQINKLKSNGTKQRNIGIGVHSGLRYLF